MMKKWFVLVLLAFLFSACVPQPGVVATSNAVQIPDALKLAINALVLFGVMFGLQFLFDKVGLDLRGVGAIVAVALSEFAILQLQGLIDIVPAQYDLLVTVTLNVILAILSSLGLVRVTLQRERAQAFLK